MLCYIGVTKMISDGRPEPADPLEWFFDFLKWGWLLALGIGWILPPVGFIVFFFWIVFVVGAVMGVIRCMFGDSSRNARASAARLRALKAPRAANGRFIKTSARERSAIGRTS
jgi:hypothetical protein